MKRRQFFSVNSLSKYIACMGTKIILLEIKRKPVQLIHSVLFVFFFGLYSHFFDYKLRKMKRDNGFWRTTYNVFFKLKFTEYLNLHELYSHKMELFEN